MLTCTVSPFKVVVLLARCAASWIDSKGAPLQLRVICENSLCSTGFHFEQ